MRRFDFSRGRQQPGVTHWQRAELGTRKQVVRFHSPGPVSLRPTSSLAERLVYTQGVRGSIPPVGYHFRRVASGRHSVFQTGAEGFDPPTRHHYPPVVQRMGAALRKRFMWVRVPPGGPSSPRPLGRPGSSKPETAGSIPARGASIGPGNGCTGPSEGPLSRFESGPDRQNARLRKSAKRLASKAGGIPVQVRGRAPHRTGVPSGKGS